MLAGLISVPLLISGLGREAFGLWALVMTFSATNGWLSLLDLGVVIAVTREVASASAVDDERGIREAVSAALWVVTALGILGAAALTIAAITFLPRLFEAPGRLAGSFRVALLLMAAQVVVDLTINTVEGALEGLQRVDLSRAVDMFRRLLFVAGTAIGALVGGNLRWVAAGSLAATVLASVVACVVLGRQLPRFIVTTSSQHLREMLRAGRLVGVLRPVGVVQRTMDRIIVGIVLGPNAVALVEVATQLQAGADAVLSASSYSVVPSSAWLGARGDSSALTRLAEIGTKYSMLATVPVAVAVGTLAGPFIEAWIGKRYLDAAGLTAMAALAVVIAAPMAVGSQMLLGLNRTSAILRAAVVAVIVNLVASSILVHVVGVVGAIWGTVIAAPVLLALLAPPVLNAAGTDLRRFIRVAVAPVIVPALSQLIAALLLLRIDLAPVPRLIVVGAGSIAVYLGMAWYSVDHAELRTVT